MAGTTAAIIHGGKVEVARIATDAFGNALGSSIAEALDPDPLGTFIGRNAAVWGRIEVAESAASQNVPRSTVAAANRSEYRATTVSYDNGPDENMYIVDGPAGAGAAGFDEADVKRGQPYPASGTTIYEGNSVRYTTHFDAENQGWWLETDDTQRMPAKFRSWGPSGNSLDFQQDWDARVGNGTYNRWTELRNIWNSDIDGLSKAKGIWQGLNYTSSTAMARWEEARRPTQFEATFSNMVSSPFASVVGGAMVGFGARPENLYYATSAVGAVEAVVSARLGFGGRRTNSVKSNGVETSGRASAVEYAGNPQVLASGPQIYSPDLGHVTGKGAAVRNRAIDSIIKEDFSNLNLTHKPEYNPFLRTGIAQEGAGTQIGKTNFSSRDSLRDVIVHEELHHRWWARGIYEHHPIGSSNEARFYETIDRYKSMRGWK